MPIAMPSARPSRAVSAVDRSVLLKCGHHRGLVGESARAMCHSLVANRAARLLQEHYLSSATSRIEVRGLPASAGEFCAELQI